MPIADDPIQLFQGDCLDVMKTMPDESFHACVTDPPYALTQASRGGSHRTNNPETPFGRHRLQDKGFMGMKWDGQLPSVDHWREVYRVLKPGAYLLSFFGTRTYHRGVVNIEDAGFEIKECVFYMFGTGFPKSRNLDGDYKGYGTALKPAVEPIVVARKPTKLNYQENMEQHGCGAFNIDACRVPHQTVNGGNLADNPHLRESINGGCGGQCFASSLTGFGSTRFPTETERQVVTPNQLGRWPAHLVHSGEDEVLEAFAVYGNRGGGDKRGRCDGKRTGGFYNIGHDKGEGEPNAAVYADSGTAARFFYCAKASRKERGDYNNHPTVKNIELMKWLIRLVCPPGGTVLDPYAGSGSTLLAAKAEGVMAVGIEREAEYCEIAKRRLAEFKGDE